MAAISADQECKVSPRVTNWADCVNIRRQPVGLSTPRVVKSEAW